MPFLQYLYLFWVANKMRHLWFALYLRKFMICQCVVLIILFNKIAYYNLYCFHCIWIRQFFKKIRNKLRLQQNQCLIRLDFQFFQLKIARYMLSLRVMIKMVYFQQISESYKFIHFRSTMLSSHPSMFTLHVLESDNILPLIFVFH